MKQFRKILRFELLGYAKNKLFVGITVFLVVASAIAMCIPNILSLFDRGEAPAEERPVMLVAVGDASLSPIVMPTFTEGFPDYEVKEAGTEAAVREAVEAGDAECGFFVREALSYTYYVENLSLYDTNTAVASGLLQETYRMAAMITGGLSPEDTAAILAAVPAGDTVTLGKDQAQNFFYTYIMIFALYTVILLYGQMVATGVATEKSSRAMELLVTAAEPTGMMFAKVLAACLAGLAQLVAVFGSAVLFYRLNRDAWGENPIVESFFNIPMGLLVYMLVFFVLGFLIYAFLYGAIGSTASKLEDINTSVMPITFLFIIAFMVVVFSMSSGSIDNIAMRICSYIPFTSPMAMFTRIAMSTVAWYEIAVSIAILAVSVVGTGVLSARIYRVGVLLYGTPPRFFGILKAVFWK